MLRKVLLLIAILTCFLVSSCITDVAQSRTAPTVDVGDYEGPGDGGGAGPGGGGGGGGGG